MGTSAFVVLLPPSEGKASGGSSSPRWKPESGVFARSLGHYRREIANELRRCGGGDQKLLGVKGAHLDHARTHNATLVGSPTLPAWQRYTGVVWDHLDLGSLSATIRESAIRRIFVPSGLAGIVRADDPLPDYRLKMGARLSPFGQLASWWRDDLTDAFGELVGSAVVVDLLPQEHKAAINWDALPRVVRLDLVAQKGGVVGGHNAKAAKGVLARHLLTTRGNSPQKIVASFSHPEYAVKVHP